MPLWPLWGQSFCCSSLRSPFQFERGGRRARHPVWSSADQKAPRFIAIVVRVEVPVFGTFDASMATTHPLPARRGRFIATCCTAHNFSSFGAQVLVSGCLTLLRCRPELVVPLTNSGDSSIHAVYEGESIHWLAFFFCTSTSRSPLYAASVYGSSLRLSKHHSLLLSR